MIEHDLETEEPQGNPREIGDIGSASTQSVLGSFVWILVEGADQTCWFLEIEKQKTQRDPERSDHGCVDS